MRQTQRWFLLGVFKVKFDAFDDNKQSKNNV